MKNKHKHYIEGEKFSTEAISLKLPTLQGQIVLSTNGDRHHQLSQSLELQADEAMLIEQVKIR